MKTIAITTFILFLCTLGFYIKSQPNNLAKTGQVHLISIKHSVDTNINNSQIKAEQTNLAIKDDNHQLYNKAYIEIKKDDKTGEEKSIVHLPKGKRLFNEESLKEISRDATI